MQISAGIFEKAWYRCFGSDVPIGCNITKVKLHIGVQQQEEEDDNLLSVLRNLQNLDLEERTTKERGQRPKGLERNSLRCLVTMPVLPGYGRHFAQTALVSVQYQYLSINAKGCRISPRSIPRNLVFRIHADLFDCSVRH
jgi:hypothetical protein